MKWFTHPRAFFLTSAVLFGACLCLGENSFVAVPHVFVRAVQTLEADHGQVALHTDTELDRLYPILKYETQVPFLDGTGSNDLAMVNHFLASKGSPLIIAKPVPDGVYLAGSIVIDVRWPEKAEVVTTRLDSGNSVPAIILPGSHFAAEGHDILEVAASGGFSAFFMEADHPLKNDHLELQQLASRLSGEKRRMRAYDRIQTPMIDLDLTSRHDEVVDKIVTFQSGDPRKICDAQIHASLKVDEAGAVAQAEEVILLAPLGVGGEPKHQVYTIRGPFVIWFEYQGICYFSAYIAEDAMRRPRPGATRVTTP